MSIQVAPIPDHIIQAVRDEYPNEDLSITDVVEKLGSFWITMEKPGEMIADES